ncbi:MAG: histone deacetylase [Candidatus Omnitrophica bacterium]|nr:histone deacetylase [Candidatus Omnitrophota bacterium]
MPKVKIIFNQDCLHYASFGHPESPERVRGAAEFLLNSGFEFRTAEIAQDKDILLAHTPRLFQAVRENNFFEPDTPNIENIFTYAKLAAGSAITAAQWSLEGEMAFSLMRPPGHHATKDNLGGFCYFNNLAIAIMRIKSKVKKISIVDFDCHHGNGTQDIFLGREAVQYISLHQVPLYPGTGWESVKNCLNYPLVAGTDSAAYLSVFKKALGEVKNFNPDLIAVSAGFDTHKDDPLGGLSLETETFEEIGRLLAHFKKPLFCVLEGGYGRALPECIYKFLKGLEQ